jgi:hypothetical protein
MTLCFCNFFILLQCSCPNRLVPMFLFSYNTFVFRCCENLLLSLNPYCIRYDALAALPIFGA